MVSDNDRGTDQQHPAPNLSSIESGDAPAHQPIADGQQAVTEETLVERIDRSDRWMIGLTGAIAFCGLVSAIIFGWQLTVMKGQLAQMEIESRPWVGVDVVEHDAEVKAAQPFKMMVFVKNFGHLPAFDVAACFGSDTPNTRQQDAKGILALFEELKQKCSSPTKTVLMPNGEFAYDVSRSGAIITDTVAYDINRKAATFAAFGGITYNDASGASHWTKFCALYVQETGRFNSCVTGNEAH